MKRYFVNKDCIDCDACRIEAPRNFSRNDAEGVTYVHKQPASSEEDRDCKAAQDACPVNAIEDEDVHEILTLDYRMIEEAIRRLTDGTCCLVDEEKVSAFDLFHKLRTALLDHIQLEERHLLPRAPGHAPSMYAEHAKIQELLTSARKALEDEQGETFRKLLHDLAEAVRNHEKLEAAIPWSEIPEVIQDESLRRMVERSGAGFLS